MNTLLEDLRQTAKDHEKYEQGGGASLLLTEAADEIEQLRSALRDLITQIEQVDGTAQLSIENAEKALQEPERL